MWYVPLNLYLNIGHWWKVMVDGDTFNQFLSLHLWSLFKKVFDVKWPAFEWTLYELAYCHLENRKGSEFLALKIPGFLESSESCKIVKSWPWSSVICESTLAWITSTPQYLEILMLNQKFFKYGFNYNWTNLSEKNKTIFENRFLKGGKIGLKMGYFQVPILDSCRRLPRYWHISL